MTWTNYIWRDDNDDDVRFVLDQHVEFDILFMGVTNKHILLKVALSTINQARNDTADISRLCYPLKF
jgi:hypothetical protein